jgi:hypothetical protein
MRYRRIPRPIDTVPRPQADLKISKYRWLAICPLHPSAARTRAEGSEALALGRCWTESAGRSGRPGRTRIPTTRTPRRGRHRRRRSRGGGPRCAGPPMARPFPVHSPGRSGFLLGRAVRRECVGPSCGRIAVNQPCLGRGGASDLREPLDEVERRLGDLVPAVVDREGVASVRDLHDLRHCRVAPLPLVRGVRDRPRHRVVLLAVDDQ